MKKLVSAIRRTSVYVKISANAAEVFISASLFDYPHPDRGLQYSLHKSCDLCDEHRI